MQGEIDIVSLIRLNRLTEFMQKLTLDRHQRYLVNKFNKYHISLDHDENLIHIERQAAEERLTEPGYNCTNYSTENIDIAVT
jgi:hypothetical protein